MDSKEFKINLPLNDSKPLEHSIKVGEVLYVLGANGTGKSTLMHRIHTQNKDNSKRIIAHRKTWFTSNALDLTAESKKQTENSINNNDQLSHSRYRDEYYMQRSSLSIFDLIESLNRKARNIANAAYAGNFNEVKELTKEQSTLQVINELLSISNLPIEITIEENEQLFASKRKSQLYSIAELSDGERNALLIAADILTAKRGSLIIIDEPERHLHRSIISPLISTLFQKRKDCAFIVSTHDISLPNDNENSSILLLRDCEWNGNNIKFWNADLVSTTNEIPRDLKEKILGAKRKVLFVEGNKTSLDKLIYELIFPDVSVIPQGNCIQVEKAVTGVNRTEELHWVKAFGLIDADDRTEEQIKRLKEKKVVALNVYSVESLYYDLAIAEKVATKFTAILGINKNETLKSMIPEIVRTIGEHKSRLCSKICEKRIRDKIFAILPNHKDIARGEIFQYRLELKEILDKEECLFDKLVDEYNLNELIKRYPVRETPALTKIASIFGISREEYESTVRKLIIDDVETREFYNSKLEPLASILS